MTLELFWEIVLDSLIDSAKILPIVFIIYLLIEFVESRDTSKHRLQKLLSSKAAPVFGAGIGVIPQCGFSVIATKLYQENYILLGTLIAVYFATSDEALPILFSQAVTNPDLWLRLILLIAIKVVYGIIVGFIINALIKNKPLNTDDCHEEVDTGCCHHEVNSERKPGLSIIVHPILHTLKIFAYIFVINIIFGLFIGLIGEEKIVTFLNSNILLQPIFSVIVGVIPNCASSVLITQMFSQGVLSLGGAVAGLTINSGLGLAVLIKDRKNIKRTLKIVGLMFALSILIGYIVTGITMLI